jgi:peptidoglycan/LPS O-acetylase OafA/YrhL
MASGSFILGIWAGQRHFNFWEAPVQMLTVGTTGLILFFAATIGYSVTASDQTLLNKVLSVSWLRLFGKYSYGIYLFHSSIIELLSPITFLQRTEITRNEDVLSSLLFTGGVVVCSFTMACVSWYAWESQFLRLKKYFPLSGKVVRPEPKALIRNPAKSTWLPKPPNQVLLSQPFLSTCRIESVLFTKLFSRLVG